MRPIFVFALLSLFAFTCSSAQESTTKTEEIPYFQIPDYPETYTAGNLMGRMIDGLGYRYYWATEGLTEKDLAYKPSEDGRTTQETLDHLYGLSTIIANAALQKPNVRPTNFPELNFEEKRKVTLKNIKVASDALKVSSIKQIEGSPIIFQRGEQKAEFPFWNLLNGPLADAIYHVGQIVVFRRAAGNPMNPEVNVFLGKTGQ